MRSQRNGVDVLGPFHREPDIDEILREDATVEQEGMVGLQRRNDSCRLPGVFFTCFRSAGSSSYKSTSIGLGGSILFLMPSRPAMSSAANVRYGFADGSGARNSRRFAFGEVEYIGMRQIAERLRCE